MNKFSTSLQIKSHPTVLSNIWSAFVQEFPNCSSEIILPPDNKLKYKYLSAIMLVSVFENVLCWQDFKRIYEIYQSLGKVHGDKKYPDQLKRHVGEIMRAFNVLLKELIPFDPSQLTNISSYAKKQDVVKEYLQKKRQFLFSFLSTQDGIDTMSKLSRGIALSLYLRDDYETLNNVKQFLKNRITRENIIKELIVEPKDIKSANHFLIEDYEIIAISHLFQLPIHTFINYLEKEATYLVKRRIHQQKFEEKTIAFLLSFNNNQTQTSCNILYQQNDNIFIKNILEPIQTTNSDFSNILPKFHQLVSNLMYQITYDFSNINALWIKKILQIIEVGEADTLIANKKMTQINDGVKVSIQQLLEQLNMNNYQINVYYNECTSLINEIEELFENLVITQVTVVRDTLGTLVKQIRHPQTQKVQEYNSQPPTRPKILNRNSLFNSQSSAPQQFQQQKILTQKSRLQAKDINSDVPIYSDDEQSEEQSSSPKKELSVPVVQKTVHVKEYNTDSDEEKYEEPNYKELLAQPINRPPNLSSPYKKSSSTVYPRLSQTNDSKKKRQRSCDRKSLEMVSQYQSEYLIQSMKDRNSTFKSEFNAINIDKDNEKLIFQPKETSKNRMFQSIRMSQSNRMSQSQTLNQSQRVPVELQTTPLQTRFPMMQSHISEVTELSSQIMSQQHQQPFICPICCDEISNQDLIRTLHEDHQLCKSCLEDWIKIKFNSGQWNFKFFNCPIQYQKDDKMHACDHIIEQSDIKAVLDEDEYKKLCDKVMKGNIIDIVCPYPECGAQIKGMPPKRGSLFCPQCNKKICWVCKNQDHQGSKCPQRLDEIKLALKDERVSCCPQCLEIYMKNDGCEHVQCTNCLSDFCFTCCAPRIPIAAHGAHYHRVGCEYRVPWINPKSGQEVLDNEYDPDACEFCKLNQAACIRPINLQEFKQLAHLNF